MQHFFAYLRVGNFRMVLDGIQVFLDIHGRSDFSVGSGSGNFKTRFSQQVNGDNMLARLQLKNDNPIVTWLETEGKALRKKNINILPQFKAMQEVEKLALNSLGVELLCPIRSKGKLVGILALGSKQSEAAYSDEELSLLMTMANEAGVVVENASMLDSHGHQQA